MRLGRAFNGTLAMAAAFLLPTLLSLLSDAVVVELVVAVAVAPTSDLDCGLGGLKAALGREYIFV